MTIETFPKIYKKYYSLDEASIGLKCSQKDIIHLAIHDNLAIYALANNWNARLWRTPVSKSFNPYGVEQNVLGKAELYFPEVNKSPNSFTKPVRLKRETLASYEASDKLIIKAFVLPDDEFHGEDFQKYEYEFRLCDPDEIFLDTSKLVLMHSELIKLKSIVKAKSDIKEASLSDKEREKLLKMVAALTMVLAGTGSKYMHGGKPNVKQVSDSVLEMFDVIESDNKDLLDKYGLKSTNLRDSISAGLKLLFDS